MDITLSTDIGSGRTPVSDGGGVKDLVSFCLNAGRVLMWRFLWFEEIMSLYSLIRFPQGRGLEITEKCVL
jgi:hypothetical protein